MKKSSVPKGVTGLPRASSAGKARKSSSTIKLPADVGIEQASSLRLELVKALADAGKVTLDVSEIQRIHAAALQLFCMFCKDRRGAGRDFSWHEPTPVLRGAAALLGATTLLGLGQEP